MSFHGSALVLGTAQWGSDYGITNAAGRISDAQCSALIAVAGDAGIRALDTAAGYGDAQRRLQPWAPSFRISTKVSGADPATVLHHIEACLVELGVEQVESVLIHDWESLDRETQIAVADELGNAVGRGLVMRVGASIYDERGIESAREAFDAAGVSLGMLQVPANPLDQRLNTCASLIEVHAAGTRIQVRSVFLQGLLVAPSLANLGQHDDVLRFHTRVTELGMNPIAVCLNHARALPWADEVVVGATTAEELQTIVTAWQHGEAVLADEDLRSNDLDLIDPRRW
jgi:aryl-alcohol dehydrogenase-like predicted oxidoreductase